MVDHLPLHAGARPTLDEVWTGLAARLPRPAAAILTGLGVPAIVWSRWADLAWIVTLSAVVVVAFGCDALLRADPRADRMLQGRARRFASGVARAAAAVAAAAIGLVLLGMIFGGKIEVMRR